MMHDIEPNLNPMRYQTDTMRIDQLERRVTQLEAKADTLAEEDDTSSLGFDERTGWYGPGKDNLNRLRMLAYPGWRPEGRDLPPSQLDRIQQIIGEWGIRTFSLNGRSHPEWRDGLLRHLSEEIEELKRACEDGNLDSIAEEAADCMLLLLNLAHREGFSIHSAIDRKHTINDRRTWETDGGEKGYRKHVDR